MHQPTFKSSTYEQRCRSELHLHENIRPPVLYRSEILSCVCLEKLGLGKSWPLKSVVGISICIRKFGPELVCIEELSQTGPSLQSVRDVSAGKEY